MSVILPGPRTPGLLRDDRISNEEDQARRLFELPKRDDWMLSTIGRTAGLANRAALTANFVRFFYLGEQKAYLTLAQVRLNVTTLSAGQTVSAALYSYVNTDARYLVKVPGSEVLFSASSTGLKTVALPNLDALPLGHIFAGIKASDNVVGVAGTAAPTASRGFPVFTYQDGAGTLVPRVLTSVLGKDYASIALDVMYLSPDATQVL